MSDRTDLELQELARLTHCSTGEILEAALDARVELAERDEACRGTRLLRISESIHGYFGLSYANYLVLPRSLLQSMPDEWQRRFVTELRELNHEFWHVEQAPEYHVQVLRRCSILIDPVSHCDDCDGEGQDEDGTPCQWCDGDGEVEEEMRYETPEEVGIMSDPVPDYWRGRTHIETATEMKAREAQEAASKRSESS